MRPDVFSYLDWTSFYDVSPMRETLAEVCDFNQLNDPTHMRVAVTEYKCPDRRSGMFSQTSWATRILSTMSHPGSLRVSLTPDHILASGSLPPGFPMTVIDRVPYWDGGLFDNTPIESLLDLLTEEEVENLPIFIVNLFATHSNPPTNLQEVQERMLEISFESRFLLEHADRDGRPDGIHPYRRKEIMRDLPADSPVRQRRSFRRLVRFRALKNIKVIEADHAPMTGGMDFSAHGVHARYKSGYAAVDKLLTGVAT